MVLGKRWGSLVLVAAIIAAVDAVVICAMLFGPGGRFAPDGAALPPGLSGHELVASQARHGGHIGKVASDVSIGTGAVPLAAPGGGALSGISDNRFGEGEGGQALLVDELAVAAVIRFSSDWAAYCNDGDGAVLSDVLEGSPAALGLDGKADGAQVAYHSLDVGNVMTDGEAYYVPVREHYTLAKDGGLTERAEEVLYRLGKLENRFVVEEWTVL